MRMNKLHSVRAILILSCPTSQQHLSKIKAKKKRKKEEKKGKKEKKKEKFEIFFRNG